MLLAFGIACGLLEVSRSGEGQVIDAAMVDGAALLAAMLHGFRSTGMWGERGTNLLDTGAWFYEVYETADGRWISVGSIEPQFCAELVRLAGLDADGPLPDQNARDTWPAMKQQMADVFRSKTRDEWCAILEATDACFAPVLSPEEAAGHPHNAARATFVDAGGVTQPAPAPRFSRTPGGIAGPPAYPGQHTDSVLSTWGFAAQEIAELKAAGAVR